MLRIVCEPACVADLTAEAVRLIDRLFPGARRLIAIDGGAVSVRVACGEARAEQTERLALRAARLPGVRSLMAEQRGPASGIVYAAAMRAVGRRR